MKEKNEITELNAQQMGIFVKRIETLGIKSTITAITVLNGWAKQ